MMRCTAVALVAAAALIGPTAACSAASSAAEADRAVSIATTHGGTRGDELVLPINAYAYTVPERDRLSRARDILTGRCMRQFGFGYDIAAGAVENDQLTRNDVADNGFYGNKRRYKLTDPATATEYGYHLVSSVTVGPQPTIRPQPAGGQSVLTTTAQAIRTGLGPDGRRVTKSPSGRPVPPGGCIGAADVHLSRFGPVREARTISGLDHASFQQSLRNAAVTAAFRAWSVCMTGKGYHYTTPLDKSGFDITTHTVSARERATARDDVSCKLQTHLIDTWFHTEVAYQKSWIQQHADQFRQARNDHDKMIKQINRIISANR